MTDRESAEHAEREAERLAAVVGHAVRSQVRAAVASGDLAAAVRICRQALSEALAAADARKAEAGEAAADRESTLAALRVRALSAADTYRQRAAAMPHDAAERREAYRLAAAESEALAEAAEGLT